MTPKLTASQTLVVERLKSGWRINAPLYPGMTNWILPDGKHSGYACAFPTLKALEKKGVVEWVGERKEWRLAASEPVITDRYLAEIASAIDTAFVAADDKLIGSTWDLDTANIVCNGLSDAQYLVSVVKQLRDRLKAVQS